MRPSTRATREKMSSIMEVRAKWSALEFVFLFNDVGDPERLTVNLQAF